MGKDVKRRIKLELGEGYGPNEMMWSFEVNNGSQGNPFDWVLQEH